MVLTSVEPQRPRVERADHQVVVLRPRVLGEPSADLAGVFALDEVGSVLARADRASDDDQPLLLDESIHKCGVVLPAVLLADSASVIPRRAVDQHAQEIGHASKVGDPSDNTRGGRSCELVVEIPPWYESLARRVLAAWASGVLRVFTST